MPHNKKKAQKTVFKDQLQEAIENAVERGNRITELNASNNALDSKALEDLFSSGQRRMHRSTVGPNQMLDSTNIIVYDSVMVQPQDGIVIIDGERFTIEDSVMAIDPAYTVTESSDEIAYAIVYRLNDGRFLVQAVGEIPLSVAAIESGNRTDLTRILQIAGIGALAPSQKKTLARLGLRAVLAATLVNLLSAFVAALFI